MAEAVIRMARTEHPSGRCAAARSRSSCWLPRIGRGSRSAFAMAKVKTLHAAHPGHKDLRGYHQNGQPARSGRKEQCPSRRPTTLCWQRLRVAEQTPPSAPRDHSPSVSSVHGRRSRRRQPLSSNSAGPEDGARQRSIDFDKDLRRRRNERGLLNALTTALSALVRAGDIGAALRQSFAHAIAGLDAEKGFVLQLVEADPLQVEILGERGLSSENEAACQVLQSSPGIGLEADPPGARHRPATAHGELAASRPRGQQGHGASGIDA